MAHAGRGPGLGLAACGLVLLASQAWLARLSAAFVFGEGEESERLQVGVTDLLSSALAIND